MISSQMAVRLSALHTGTPRKIPGIHFCPHHIENSSEPHLDYYLKGSWDSILGGIVAGA
jgi:hypothetical protein